MRFQIATKSQLRGSKYLLSSGLPARSSARVGRCIPVGFWSSSSSQSGQISSSPEITGSSSSGSRSGFPYRKLATGSVWVIIGYWANSLLHTQREGDEYPAVPTTDQLRESITGAAAACEDAVTKILNQEAFGWSNSLNSPGPVGAYHAVRVGSSSPVEDRLIHGVITSDYGLISSSWNAWGVFDGHAGSQTAELLTKQLLPTVQQALQHLPATASNEVVESTIKNAFVSLDDRIVKGALELAVSNVPYQDRVASLAQAYAGSCALLSLLDPTTRILRVACVGDSRAVLGQKQTNEEWIAIPLSVDQTGSNEDEIARINSEHPGENDIFKGGRVLGIMVSRGFGDARHKWDAGTLQELSKQYDGFAPLPPSKYTVKTPPYLTAEPVITTTQLDEKAPAFLIMASDGFWDRVTNDQAVNLVSRWIELRDRGELRKPISVTDHGRFDLEKHRQGSSGFRYTEDRATFQDENVAVHLVRNALGGNFHEMVAGTLAVGPPFSRELRDDITVQVVFFPSK
ncbi:hypothetical protein JX265_008789 [Neoarthrinium moseri]|uniref:PPM-type phosphatase domain-containing protein n=1 Tax=Neoarthrinium moseri TaxID=1658444 RepID=A0A9Q0ALV5_9PEZI|nr:hypothetical protein JX266_005735 [Neoarthrinium moseri]KAI1863572.1 hypothetical protein JX265_008789 [Neoarthrinium moseri]